MSSNQDGEGELRVEWRRWRWGGVVWGGGQGARPQAAGGAGGC